MHRLSERGLQTYSRNGKATGVDHERKYRFASLGYDEKKLGELNYRDQALKGIQIFRDRDEKNQNKQIEDEVSIETEKPEKTNTDYKGEDEVDNENNEIVEDNEAELGLDMDI